MPQPSAAAFDLTDERFQAELALLAQRHPAEHAQLGVEIVGLLGASWPAAAIATSYAFREDQFDGRISIGSMSFCNKKIELVVLTDSQVIKPVTFKVPDFYPDLGDRP